MPAQFNEGRFPTYISFDAVFGPGFKTSIFEAGSGFEQRNVDWSMVRCSGDIAPAISDDARKQEVLSWFYVSRGKAIPFRYKDHHDFTIENAQPIGTGDGVETQFQVFKHYAAGDQTYDRTIYKLVSGTVVVYLDGVPQGSGFTVNLNTGVITFTSPPAGSVVVGVDCEFDVPVRFDVDKMDLRGPAPNYYEWEVPIVEVRL